MQSVSHIILIVLEHMLYTEENGDHVLTAHCNQDVARETLLIFLRILT